MFKQFITIISLFALIISAPIKASSEGIAAPGSYLPVNGMPVLSNIPSLRTAFDIVADTLAPNPILVVDYNLDLTLGSDNSWNIHVVYYDADINELRQKHFSVYSIGDPNTPVCVEYSSMEYPDIYSSVPDPLLVTYIADRTTVWESYLGPWHLWDVSEKAAFYELYGVSPEYIQSWGYPENEELSIDDARDQICLLVRERFEVELENIIAEEDVRYCMYSNGNGYWRFTYWTQCLIDDEIHWVALFSLVEYQNEMQWERCIDPSFISMFLYSNE